MEKISDVIIGLIFYIGATIFKYIVYAFELAPLFIVFDFNIWITILISVVYVMWDAFDIIPRLLYISAFIYSFFLPLNPFIIVFYICFAIRTLLYIVKFIVYINRN